MKKYLLSMAVLLSATLFTACDDKDNGNNSYVIPVAHGAYVLCSGNTWSGINGSLTYIDYVSGTSANDQFYAKNGRTLGGTPNDIMIYGNKMYITVTDENTVEVMDAKTLSSIKQIKLTDLMGKDKGVAPRRLTAADGLIYVSTYGGCSNTSDPETWAITTEGNGYVAAIDTISFSLKEIYTAGSYPEGITIAGSYLVVANSDYSAVTKASIDLINLKTKETKTITDSKITNPTSVAVTVSGTDIFVLDMGDYATVKGGIRVIKNSGSVTSLFDCTNATFVGHNIYAANCTYGETVDHFMVYDLRTNSKRDYPSGVDKFYYPNVVTADPITGHIFVASYSENADYPNTPNYSANGYVVEYDENGKMLKEYSCGVGPNAMAFNMSYEEIIY